MSFEQMWRDLAPVGRSASTGGYFRQPFTAPEREASAWFLEQCRARDLEVSADEVGNVVAWWRPPGTFGGGVLTGSHLDSVLDGGAYDGPLGVVSALAAIDLLRARGFTPERPIGVAVFVEEEGSRFGIACLGSRLLTGAVTMAKAKQLRDADGVAFLDAVEAADLPRHHGDASRLDWARLRATVDCYVELHVEQGRDLVDRRASVGVATGIRPHGRYRFEFAGVADHAGTTRMEDRLDPMLACAMTVLAANKQARLAGQRATFGRVDVHPNQTNAVPSRVLAWLDARAESAGQLEALVSEVARMARDRAARDGTTVTFTTESTSPEVVFDKALARRIAHRDEGRDLPSLATYAGHDAGILSAAGLPTAMLFVRNPTGVSHSPAERAEMADCLTGVEVLAETLARLSGGDR